MIVCVTTWIHFLLLFIFCLFPFLSPPVLNIYVTAKCIPNFKASTHERVQFPFLTLSSFVSFSDRFSYLIAYSGEILHLLLEFFNLAKRKMLRELSWNNWKDFLLLSQHEFITWDFSVSALGMQERAKKVSFQLIHVTKYFRKDFNYCYSRRSSSLWYMYSYIFLKLCFDLSEWIYFLTKFQRCNA